MNNEKELENLVAEFAAWRKSKMAPTSRIPDTLFLRALDFHHKCPELNVKLKCLIPNERWQKAIASYQPPSMENQINFMEFPIPEGRDILKKQVEPHFILELELPSGIKLRFT